MRGGQENQIKEYEQAKSLGEILQFWKGRN